MDVGAVHEAVHEQEVKGDPKVASYKREMVIKADITDDVQYSGRCDFEVQYYKVGTVIHETKSTVSRSTRDHVIRKGQVKLNHLAQLVSYLIQLKTTRGKIVCGYYELNEVGDYERVEAREFKVTIRDNGAIYIDGEHSGFNVEDQIAHALAAAKVLSEQRIWERPEGHDAKWKSPCTFCPFKKACDKYDAAEITTVSELVEAAREDVKGYVVKEPTVNKRRKKNVDSTKV
jgi:hypothetical protein